MHSIKARIEKWFESWARFVIRFRYLVFILVMAGAVLMSSQVRYLGIDTSNEGLLHPDDPILTTYNQVPRSVCDANESGW